MKNNCSYFFEIGTLFTDYFKLDLHLLHGKILKLSNMLGISFL